MTRFAVLAMALVLSGCAAEGPPPAAPHGYVAGAEETAEAQSRLVVADGESGAVRVVDLLTEEIHEVDPVEGISAISGDGRYVYLTADRSVHIVDSGAWQVDHGDHVHYYRAEVRAVGTLTGHRAARAHSDPATAAVSSDGGAVTLLDRAGLDRGEIAETGAVEPGGRHPTAVPYREHVLVSDVDTVAAHTGNGEKVATIGEPCPEPRGATATRRGVVFGCADGALLVTEADGEFTGAKIPYPATEAEPAQEFRHRRTSTTLVAPVGAHGVWVLDVTARSWTLVPTGPVVAANTAGEGAPLLTLTEDGVLHAFDVGTGAEITRTRLLTGPVEAPVIEVDPTRAYVNDAAARTVHEIDYNDNLRVARTFPLDITPTHLVETGR